MYRIFLVFISLLLATFLLLNQSQTLDFGRIDLSQYWSASKVFFEGGNPYDPAQLEVFQNKIPGHDSLIRMWNPPFIFALIAPFSFFGFESLVSVWLFVSLLLVFLSFVFSYKSLSTSFLRIELDYIYALAVAFSFPSIYQALFFGQITPILAVSISGFIFFFSLKFGFLAGLFLSMSFIKPHLLMPIYLWLAYSRLRGNSKSIFLGFLLGLITLGALPLFINANIYQFYFEALKSPPIYFKNAALGSLLQGLTGIHTAYIRFLPSLMFLLTFVVYLLKFKKNFLNLKEIILILPLSMLFAPYSWGYDWLLLIPLIVCFAIKTNLRQVILLSLVNALLILQVFGAGIENYFWYPLVLWLLALQTLNSSYNSSSV